MGKRRATIANVVATMATADLHTARLRYEEPAASDLQTVRLTATTMLAGQERRFSRFDCFTISA